MSINFCEVEELWISWVLVVFVPKWYFDFLGIPCYSGIFSYFNYSSKCFTLRASGFLLIFFMNLHGPKNSLSKNSLVYLYSE